MSDGERTREPLAHTAEEIAQEHAFLSLYGPWEPLDPAGAAHLLGGFSCPWWVVGGWAVEAFTGRPREHEDLDVSILTRDVSALRAHLGDSWHLWTNESGTLRPLTDRYPDVPAPDCQLWLRRHAQAPWVLDIPLTPDRDGLWTNKRRQGHVARVEDVTWVAPDGIRYLAAEIALQFKARSGRAKDERDLAVTWPLLDARQRAWLRDAVREQDPDHAWLPRLS